MVNGCCPNTRYTANRSPAAFWVRAPNKGGPSGSDDLLGDLVAKAWQGARGETGAHELLEWEKTNAPCREVQGVAAVAAVVGLASSGAAYAYWTNSGSGSGTAATGTNVAVTVNQASTVTGLAPGLLAQALSGTFDNPNAGPVFVAAVTATVTGTDKAGCGPTDYAIAGTATVNAEIAPATGAGAWSGLTIQFNNKPATNQDACKGANVTLAYTSS